MTRSTTRLHQGDCIRLNALAPQADAQQLYQVISVDPGRDRCWLRRWPLARHGSPVFEMGLAQLQGSGPTVVALVGDGAFQMTGMELSAVVRRGLSAVVIVLDNKGYGTERLIHEGSFNDINPWQYQLLPQVLGGGTGYEVRTEGEFDAALARALADTSGMSIIRAHIGIDDRSVTLDRLAAGLARRVQR